MRDFFLLTLLKVNFQTENQPRKRLIFLILLVFEQASCSRTSGRYRLCNRCFTTFCLVFAGNFAGTTGLCENSKQCLKNARGSGIFPLAFFVRVQQFVFCNRQIAVGQVFLKNNQNKNTRRFRVRFFVAKCVSLHKFVQPYVKKRCYLTYQLS